MHFEIETFIICPWRHESMNHVLSQDHATNKAVEVLALDHAATTSHSRINMSFDWQERTCQEYYKVNFWNDEIHHAWKVKFTMFTNMYLFFRVFLWRPASSK